MSKGLKFIKISKFFFPPLTQFNKLPARDLLLSDHKTKTQRLQ